MSSETYVTARNAFFNWGYRHIAKPVFFMLDPEVAHDRISDVGAFVGSTALGRSMLSAAFDYANPILEQEIAGIRFANPLGLAAGFDKDARLLKVLPKIGFGFAEIGSVTSKPCAGNPPPRLYRLKKSNALIVYYGLRNIGAEAVAERFERLEPITFPFGTSIAPVNGPENDDISHAIADYCVSFRRFAAIGAYTTINVSCPNTCNSSPFLDPGPLEELLRETDKIATTKPTFLKVSPDLSQKQITALMNVAAKHKVSGFIAGNLTKKRENEAIKDTDLPIPGGISGLPTQKLSEHMISHIAREGKGRFIVIGCGGTFSADVAYRKIRLGASLVQMITGMIYGGPQTISAINQGVVHLLKRDGFSSVSEAVGTNL